MHFLLEHAKRLARPHSLLARAKRSSFSQSVSMRDYCINAIAFFGNVTFGIMTVSIMTLCVMTDRILNLVVNLNVIHCHFASYHYFEFGILLLLC
jgi:hypothetical protein